MNSKKYISQVKIGSGSNVEYVKDIEAQSKIAQVAAAIGVVANYEFVDLGLPSGTLWAKCNVGATTETGYGNYYMYGKGAKTYVYGDDPYEGVENPLDLSVDTAAQVMGGLWQMPTVEQIQELIDNTTHTWEANFNNSGINGMKFTATNGNYIFIPAAGYYGSASYPSNDGLVCYLWSNKPNTNTGAAYLRFLKSGEIGITDLTGGRAQGKSVRGVCPAAANNSISDKLSTLSNSIDNVAEQLAAAEDDLADQIAGVEDSIQDGTFSVKGAGTEVASTSANTSADTSVNIVAGSHVTVTPNASAHTITISSTDTTYNAATQSAAGLMSAADKTKLDGIATGAQVNSVTGVKGDSESSYRTGNVNITKANVGLGNVTNDSQVKRSEMGAASGVATLGTDGKIPSSQLPSYVDDVLEYTNLASFPSTGESGKIYVALDTNKTYRWSGSAYVEISASIVIGTTAGTAYDGASGAALKSKLDGIENGAQVHIAPTAAEVKSALGTGSGTTKYLREDGTWQTPPDHTYTVNNGTFTIKGAGTAVGSTSANTVNNTAVDIVAGNNVTITPDATNGKITIASSYTNTDTLVTQTATNTNANYEVLFSATADNTTRTEGARKYSNLLFNPSTGNLQATQLNGVAIGSSPKFTDTNTWRPVSDSVSSTSSSDAASSKAVKTAYDLAASKTANTGTVTKVSTGVGLTGGDITTSGTVKANLLSETKLTNAAAAATETSGRIYPIALDKDGKLAVNVPWSDTNTWRPVGTGATDAAAGNHTHGISIAADSGTNALTMAANTKYKITAGGQSFIFTTPPDNNTTYNFSGTSFTSNNSTGLDANAVTYNAHTYYTSNGPTTALGASTNDGALYTQAYSTSWVGQIAQDYRNGNLFTRGKNNGTWQNWRKVMYTGDALTKAQVTDALGYTPPTLDTNTTYSAGTGLSLSGTTFSLATSGVTAGTYKRVTVDAYGRVTSGDNTDANDNTARLQISDATNKRINTKESTGNYIQFTGGTDKFSISDGTSRFDVAVSHINSDTKNTAGTSNNVNTKLFLAGATSQTDGVQTFSNKGCYIGTDNNLYSDGSKTVTATNYKSTISAASTSANGLMSSTDKSKLNGIETGAQANAENITWSSLKSKRDNSQLVPGKWYRITDYTCTTAQEYTRSAGHAFDVIVRADATNVLNENAYAAKHSGDTYFTNAGAKLEAWELKYCIDNNKTKFLWADSTNGKGVIWWMRDEWGNECPYDFKNIQFLRYKIDRCISVQDLEGTYAINDTDDITVDTDTEYWCYTFSMIDTSNGVAHDVSVEQDKYLSDEGFAYKQKNNILRPCYHGYLDEDIDQYVYVMRLPNNVFVTDTDQCAIEEGYGEFYGFYDNSFGNNCFNNTIGNECYRNIIGSNFQGNTIGNSFRNNTIGGFFRNNTIGRVYYNNTIGGDFDSNTIKNCFYSNTIGGNFRNNTIGNSFYFNTIGNGCNNIRILKDYVYYIIIENGNQYIDITSNKTTSSGSMLRNFTVAQGVNNSSTTKTISHNSVNDTFKTTYQNASSTTVNV